MINTISVNNFRSLENLRDVKISPITILLGKNSSGKSSFLRLFPLFKQSVIGKTRGAISLYGDFVDFGEFDTVITNGSASKTIDFSFNGFIKGKEKNFKKFFFEESLNRDINYTCNISISENKKEDYLYIENFVFKYEENVIKFSIDNKTKKLLHCSKNECQISSYVYENLLIDYFSTGSILPDTLVKMDEHSYSSFHENILLINYLKSSYGENFFSREELIKIQQNFVLPKKDDIVDYFMQEILTQDLINQDRNENFIKSLSEEKLNQLFDIIIINDFLSVYNAINNDLRLSFRNTFYSKPIRTNTERFYRNQPFVVNEVDPDGSNVIQFYSNMSEKQKKEFQDWMDANFDFHFDTEKQPGFKSIMIYEKTDLEHPHNITDMGFGYTQILPIVTQLWTLSNKITKEHNRDNLVYAIEQPELHLHPAFQCKLINTFLKLIEVGKKKGIFIRFIVETHSETIVNHLGREISRNHITQDDVSVLIFSKENKKTIINTVGYSPEGILKNWPIGFFGEK